MSFRASAQDIRVDDGHILRARLSKVNGEQHEDELDLDKYIGNADGHFVWGGNGFSASAQNISFSLEGDDSRPMLKAQLTKADGATVSEDVINLGDRIGNSDGNFEPLL